MNGLKFLLIYLVLFSLWIVPIRISANPDINGSVIVNGSASFNQQGTTLNITNTPGTIINWQDFSIQSNETTRFIQQSVDSTVLNRVVGQAPSQILGKLQSNGRVFLINPNGILFGRDSVIDVNGLVASTLNLSNENFISNQLNFDGNSNNGAINNQGALTSTEGGFIYLIAPNIENHGVITSPKGDVILAAGHSVQLVNSDDPDIRVTLTAPEGEAINVGEIITRGGKTSIYAGIINQQGKVSADSVVVGENGKIFFKAIQRTTLTSASTTSANSIHGGSVTIKTTQGITEVSGVVTATGDRGQGGEILILGEHVGILDEANIDVSGKAGGGTILIGGDNKGENPNIKNAKATYVGVNTQIHADAINEGDGGKVIIWSDDATRAYGTITAKGGRVFGNGGFVETSGGYLDVAGLNLDVTASNGDGGAWLLDPYDITISGTTTINSTAGPTYTPTATGSNINAVDIITQLNAGTFVTVDTTGAGAETGNITVNAAIIKTGGAAASLTLKAHNNIITNNNIGSISGALDIVLNADQDSSGAGSVTLNGMLNSLNGNVTVSADGDITFNSGTDTINAGTGTVTLTSASGWVHGDPAGAPTDVTANTVVLNALNGIFANSGAAQFTTKAANITFNKSGTVIASEVKIHNSYVGPTTITGINSRGNISIFNTYNAAALTVGNITATTDGYISINSDIVDITGSINAGTNVVYLKNFVNNAAISLEGGALFDINSTELGNITAGNIQIGRDPFGNYAGAATIASSANLDVGGKNLWVTAKNGVTVSAFNVNNTGGEFYLDNITTGNIQTGSGVITSDKIQFRSIGNVNIGSGGINSTALGNVYLLGADVNITGTINAGTNNVYLSPYLPNTAISIGGSQTFDITQADINNILTSDLWIGSPDGSTTYAGIVDITSISAIDAGARKFYVFGTDNITVGANDLAATGGLLYFDNYTSGKIFTSGTGSLNANDIIIASNGTINIGSGGLTSIGYSLLKGTDVNIGGTINAGTGDVYLLPYSTGIAMSIGGAQTFDLTQTDLTNITANVIHVGENQFSVVYAGQVDISTSAAVNLGTRNINVLGAGNITVGNNSFSVGGLNINSSAGGSITTGAGTITTNGMSINSAGNLTIGIGGVSSSAAGINLSAANNIFQNGNIDITSSNFISLFTAGGTINMSSTAVSSTNGGNITYSANGNIALGRLYTGVTSGDVSVTSTTGSITDVGTVSPDNVFASTATLSAATGIGTTGFNVYFNNLGTTNLIASTSSGGIDINSKSAMNVGAINSGSSNFILTSTAPGSYITTTSNINGAGGSIDSSDNLTIGAGGITSAGNLSLNAVGTLSQSGNITTTAGGSILLQANATFLNNITSAGNIGINTNQISIANAINAGTNGVYIVPLTNNPISIDGSEVFDLTQGEINNITAGNLLIGTNDVGTTRATTASISTNASTTINNSFLEITALNNITFGVNNFTATGADIIFKSGAGSITTGAGLITAPSLLDFYAPGTVTVGTGGLNANDIAIEAGDINITGNISGSLLYLNPYAAGTNISIGGSETFNLVQSDINNINSTNTYIGNDSFVVKTNNIDISSVSAIDFGAGLFTLDANMGITTGSFALAATGGSLTMVTRNVGADITTGSAMVSASNLAFTSAGNLTFGTGGVSSTGSVSMYAANSIIQNGNISSSGVGAVTLTASTADIIMASGTTATNSSGDINLASGNNIVLASLNAGTGNITINAGNNITDANGAGVNNIDASNLTVIAGANASLDYQIITALNSTGVIGTADLRLFPATTTTTTASTNEPVTTTITTISDTTNSLSTDTSLSGTSTTTAPLEDTSTSDTTTSPTDDSTQTSTDTAEETTTTSDDTSEEELNEEQIAATEKNDEKESTLTAKKLPICK